MLITDKNGLNNNYKPYSWGTNYKIQSKKGNQWKDLVPIISESDIVYQALSYNGEFTNGLIPMHIDFTTIYGNLSDGTYRIVMFDELGGIFYSNQFKIKGDV